MLELKNVSKRYVTKGGTVNALDGVNLYLEDTGMVFVLGKSGSGKSTLLNVVGGLDKYDSGEIIIKGKSSSSFKGSDFDSYRNTFIGFIFQEYNILEDFTVAKNIGLALELQGRPADKQTIDDILETVDMPGLGDRKPNTLSGGQKQRVAIARALVKNPEIIMADEPTGALDSNTGRQVFETLQKLSQTKLVMVVSHDRDFAEKYGSRIIELADGKVISDVKRTNGGKFIDMPVRQISDTAFSIRQGTKLTADDLDALNAFLAQRKEDVFLTTASGVTPTIKNAAEVKEGVGGFKDTKEQDIVKKKYDKSDFKLLHSRLPLKHAFKMGGSGLKVKPIRLAFTILLSMLSFAFFGVADTVGNFKRQNAAADLLVNEETDSLVVRQLKMQNTWERDMNIYKSQIDELNEKFDKLNFVPGSDNSLTLNKEYNSLTESESRDKFTFNGFLGITQAFLTKNNFTVAGNLPQVGEIALSKEIAQNYIGERVTFENKDGNAPTKTINSVNDFLGQSVRIDNDFFVISAIIDSGKIDSKYKEEKPGDYEFSNKKNGYFTRTLSNKVFMSKEGFDEYMGSALNPSQYGVYINYVNATTREYLNSFYNEFYEVFNKDSGKNIFFDSAKTDLADDEMLISLPNFIRIYNNDQGEMLGYNVIKNNFTNALNGGRTYNAEDYLSEDIIDQWGSNPEVALDLIFLESDKRMEEDKIKRFINDYSDILFTGLNLRIGTTNWSNDKQEQIDMTYKIAGLFLVDDDGWDWQSPKVTMSDSGYKKLTGQRTEMSYYYAISAVDFSDTHLLRSFLAYSYTFDNDNARLGLINYEIQTLDGIYSMIKIMSKVFMYIGIGFAVFSALLMLNFISTSIQHKRREIGILRAIGARSNDVFSIFFSESFIIAAINAFIAIIVTFIGIMVLNGVFKKELLINANFLYVGLRQIALIAGISVGTAFISSFLPVKKIASKKPIDSIRNT